MGSKENITYIQVHPYPNTIANIVAAVADSTSSNPDSSSTLTLPVDSTLGVTARPEYPTYTKTEAPVDPAVGIVLGRVVCECDNVEVGLRKVVELECADLQTISDV